MPKKKRTRTLTAEEQIELCYAERAALQNIAGQLAQLCDDGATDAKLRRAAAYEHRHCRGEGCLVGPRRNKGIRAVRHEQSQGRTKRGVVSTNIATLSAGNVFMGTMDGDITTFWGLGSKHLAQFCF